MSDQKQINDEQQEEINLNKALEVIKKPSRLRTIADIEFLIEHTSHIPFFQEYKEKTPEVHWLCCQYMKYEYYPNGEYVFEIELSIDTIGNKFYIILKGEVQIKIRIGGKMVGVAKLKNNQSFGELALINDAPRSASIITTQDTHFAIIQKDIFMLLVNKIEEDFLNKQINFMWEQPIFSTSFQKQDLRQIWKKSKEKIYTVGDRVFSYNQPSENVYIVKHGDFTVVQDFKQELKNDQFNILKEFQKPEQPQSKELPLMTFSNGQIFGEEDLLKNRNRSFSVKCGSDEGILLIISKQLFEEKFLSIKNFNEYLMNMQVIKDNYEYQQQNMIQDSIKDYRKYLYQNKSNKRINYTQLQLREKQKSYQKLKTEEDSKQLENKEFIDILAENKIDVEYIKSKKPKNNLISEIVVQKVIEDNRQMMTRYYNMIGDDKNNHKKNNKTPRFLNHYNSICHVRKEDVNKVLIKRYQMDIEKYDAEKGLEIEVYNFTKKRRKKEINKTQQDTDNYDYGSPDKEYRLSNQSFNPYSDKSKTPQLINSQDQQNFNNLLQKIKFKTQQYQNEYNSARFYINAPIQIRPKALLECSKKQYEISTLQSDNQEISCLDTTKGFNSSESTKNQHNSFGNGRRKLNLNPQLGKLQNFDPRSPPQSGMGRKSQEKRKYAQKLGNMLNQNLPSIKQI